jgi:hypothetical protein
MDDATAALRADNWHGLCLFLDGMPDSFTGLLLSLTEKADPGNREKLRGAFPRQVAAWEEWRAHAPLSWGELDRLTEARVTRMWSDPAHLECGRVVPGAGSVVGDD